MIKSIISYNPICPSEVFKAIFNKTEEKARNIHEEVCNIIENEYTGRVGLRELKEIHQRVREESAQTLEFKMDASLDDEMDTFIPEGTVVNVWDGPQREGSTRIIYNGEVIEYMNFTFK